MAQNKKEQVEDIFEETEKSRSKRPVVSNGGRPTLENAMPTAPATTGVTEEPVEPAGFQSGRKRFIKIGLLVIVSLVVIVGVVLASGILNNDQADNSNSLNSNKSPGGATDTEDNGSLLANLTNLGNGKTDDADGDGLTDSEEAELGTSSTVQDSDADGLFDREEAKVYQTDPLNKDSDNDGKTDGAEVAEGLNPKGAGQLLNLDGELEKINQ